MAEYEVTCINKPHRENIHEHITHIGNVKDAWRMTRELAISQIESKQNQFYTTDRQTGKRSPIGVVRETGKAPYLRSYADGEWNNNLLAQQECGSTCKLVG
jgi:hypothetical protein